MHPLVCTGSLPVYHVHMSFYPSEMQKHLLEVMCGVVSERTKRLCSRSVNCPQHSEEQRRELRVQLCGSADASASPAPKKKSTHHSVDDDSSGEADWGLITLQSHYTADVHNCYFCFFFTNYITILFVLLNCCFIISSVCCLILFADIKELESLIPPASTSSSKKNSWETSSTVSTASSISQASFAQPHKEGECSTLQM